MAQKLTASLPEGMELDQTYMVAFTAVDPTTGAVVSAVKVSQASLLVTNLSDTSDEQLQSGPFMLVPGPGA